MEKLILLILLKSREEIAVEVQSVLTQYGCFIKTRLGIHDGVPTKCSPSGLVILEWSGDKSKVEECKVKLEALKHVNVQLVKMKVD